MKQEQEEKINFTQGNLYRPNANWNVGYWVKTSKQVPDAWALKTTGLNMNDVLMFVGIDDPPQDTTWYHFLLNEQLIALDPCAFKILEPI